MKLYSKGQGMSINVIVIAALALTVLVVLSFLLISRATNVNTETKSCENAGGVCTSRGIGVSPQAACGSKRVLSNECATRDQTCCLNIG